ncbi:MAG TPA: biotin transporter BioY [Syntrophomonas sp.]|nr:biotin transporter BioY [Syntrophomonas sp.]
MNRLDSSLKRMVYAAMFGALTALGAFIVIPLQPVPISLQTLFCGLAGVLLGGYTGALSQIVYVLLGIIGLPVFAGGKAGLGTLFGPTGGYLLGFIAAAFVIGKIIESKPQASAVRIVAALLAGNLVIYLCGTLQLSVVADLSLMKSLMAGVIPFLPGDVLKLAAAAWIGYKLQPLFRA